jgi:hypothetical protein
MRTRARPGRIAAGVIGGLVSATLIALVFLRVETRPLRLVARFSLSAWFGELPSHLPWVVPFVLLTLTLAPLRAALWGATLPRPVPRYGSRLLAIALGGLVHNVLPGRLGLLGSAYVLGRRAERPVPEAFAALLLMKLLELAALVTTTAITLAVLHTRGVAGAGLRQLVGAGMAVVVISAAAILATARWAPRAQVLASSVHAWVRRLGLMLAQVAAGLTAVGTPARLAVGFLVAFGPVAASALAYGLALGALDARTGVLGGGLLLGAITLAQFTPGLPIGAGVHYVVAAWAARELGVTEPHAVALAALTHASTVVAHLAFGVTAALARRRELSALLPRRGTPPTPT